MEGLVRRRRSSFVVSVVTSTHFVSLARSCCELEGRSLASASTATAPQARAPTTGSCRSPAFGISLASLSPVVVDGRTGCGTRHGRTAPVRRPRSSRRLLFPRSSSLSRPGSTGFSNLRPPRPADMPAAPAHTMFPIYRRARGGDPEDVRQEFEEWTHELDRCARETVASTSPSYLSCMSHDYVARADPSPSQPSRVSFFSPPARLVADLNLTLFCRRGGAQGRHVPRGKVPGRSRDGPCRARPRS